MPMPLSIKRVMHIHRCIEVGIRLIVTHGTKEEFPPFHAYAFAASVREPLALSSASRAILGCPMWIYLNGDNCLSECFLSGIVVDLTAKLVGLPAVHAS